MSRDQRLPLSSPPGGRWGGSRIVPLSLIALALVGTPGRAEDLPERGRLIEGLRCQGDPTQTYTLYLPPTYTGERVWPTLLVLDPGGRSVHAAELFVDAAKEYGWILLSSNDTRSDGPMEPNTRALRALLVELNTRYAVDPARLYLAGFSGLGTLAWELARDASDVAGVIVSGSPVAEDPNRPDRPLRVPCFGTVGDTDFNYAPMMALHAEMREQGTPERLEIFEGRHSWMPPELGREAIEWMELQAMKKGQRPVDEALVGRLLSRDRERAAQLEAMGQPLAALRTLQDAVSTFAGLVSIEDLQSELDRLENAPATRRAQDEEKRWDRYETAMLRRHGEAYLRLSRTDPPPVPGLLRSLLKLDELQEHAAAGGYESVVARRLLEALSARLGSYLTPAFLASGSLVRAQRSLEIATELRPDRPDFWYNLACVQARLGAHGPALDALERAVATGFTDRAHMVADEDLRSLRDTPRFQALLGEAEVPQSAGPP